MVPQLSRCAKHDRRRLANGVTSVIEIRLAVTPEEVHTALQLRYDVFTEEFGDERYADHSARIYRDQFDIPGALINIAVENDCIIGTMRVFERESGPYIGDEMHEWGKLAATLGKPEDEVIRGAVIVTRGAVARPFRRLGILGGLIRHAHALAADRGRIVSLGTVAVGNEESARQLRRAGYESYGVRQNQMGWLGEYFFCRLDGCAQAGDAQHIDELGLGLENTGTSSLTSNNSVI